MLLDADVLDSQTIKKQDKNVKKNTGDDDIPWNTIYQVLDDENDWKSEDVDGLYPKIPKNERSIMRTGFGNNKFKENIVEPYPHIERMRITANNPREISLYTTGEVESDGKIASPVIRGDVPGAVGTHPWLVSANINEKKRQRQFYDDLYNNKLGKFKKGGSRKTTKKSNNITKSNKTTKRIIYPLGVHLNNTELVGYIEEQPSGELQYKTEISPGVDPKPASFLYTRTNPPSPAPIITEDFKFDAPAIATLYKKKGGSRKTKKNRSKGGAPRKNKKEQSYEVLKKLKEDNIIGPTEQKDLNYMFYKYSKNGDAKRVLELLLSGTINVNMVDASGNTALMIASDYGHTHLVKILLNNGADPNIENKNGWTAIDFATGFLLEQGLNKKEVLGSQLFSLLAGAGGRPGSSFHDTISSPQNTRAVRHMTTPPGIDDKSGGKKKTRKHRKK